MGIPRQAARLASLYNSGGLLDGLRNKLLNGSCFLIQRGSRSIAAGASAYVLDRFLVTNNTNQPVTVSQNNLGLASGFAPGGRHTMRLNFATAPTTGTLRVEQRCEGVDSIRPDLWTFIAWMSGPAGTEAVAAEFVQNFGTGGSPSAQVVTPMTFAGESPQTIQSASTNRRAWVVQVPSLSAKLLGTGGNDYAAPAVVMTPRQAGNYDVTWMSLVEGDATGEFDPFSPQPQPLDLLMCQRFYEKSYDQATVPGTVANLGMEVVIANSGGTAWLNCRFKVPKRALPNMTPYAPATGAVNSGTRTDTNANVTAALSHANTTAAFYSAAVGASSGFTLHWVADAEIT